MSISIQPGDEHPNHHVVLYGDEMVGKFFYVPALKESEKHQYWLLYNKVGLLFHGRGHTLLEVYDIMEEYFTLLTKCYCDILSTDPLFDCIKEHQIPYLEWNVDFSKSLTCGVMFIMDETAYMAVQLLK